MRERRSPSSLPLLRLRRGAGGSPSSGGERGGPLGTGGNPGPPSAPLGTGGDPGSPSRAAGVPGVSPVAAAGGGGELSPELVAELARGLEQVGIAAITVHGRTTKMYFKGSVRHEEAPLRP